MTNKMDETEKCFMLRRLTTKKQNDIKEVLLARQNMYQYYHMRYEVIQERHLLYP